MFYICCEELVPFMYCKYVGDTWKDDIFQKLCTRDDTFSNLTHNGRGFGRVGHYRFSITPTTTHWISSRTMWVIMRPLDELNRNSYLIKWMAKVVSSHPLLSHFVEITRSLDSLIVPLFVNGDIVLLCHCYQLPNHGRDGRTV